MAIIVNLENTFQWSMRDLGDIFPNISSKRGTLLLLLVENDEESLTVIPPVYIVDIVLIVISSKLK